MEEKQKEAKIEKIGFKIILLTIVLLNIFIGSNIKQPIWIIQAIVSIFTTIYLIINIKNKKKNLIIKGKIDIAVMLFMIATIIPLLFRQQVTLEGTCNFILKYWSVFGMYILVRNIVTTKEKIKIIINTIIISSIIPIIIGYDKKTLNILEPLLDLINSVKIEEARIVSIFGYANTFALYLGLTTSLAISQFLNTKSKKIKALYVIYIIIAVITIMLTLSKSVMALLALIILLFIIKEIKNKKIPIKFIIAGIIAVVAFFIYFFVAIQIGKPLEITEEEKTCVIRGIDSNTKYELEFDIETQTEKEYNTFEITVVEVTRYFSEKTIGRINFAKFDGNKTINVKTNDEIDHLEIRIKNKLKGKITIKELKINNSKYIVEYKIIPEELVRVFTTFNLKNPSVWQRADYWKDGLDILKDKWLLGAGGNTWRTLYGQKQDYLYYAKEAHCYILEVGMSFGILGLLSYIVIIAISIQNGAKKLKNDRNMLAIIIGAIIIVIHSLMDFDMSYLIMEMIFYIFIAIINIDDKRIQKDKKIIEIPIILMFVIISIGNVLGLIAGAVEDETGILSKKIAPWISRYQYNEIVYIENNKIQDKDKIEKIKQHIENEPYNYQNIMYEIMSNQLIKETNTDDIQYLINVWRTIPKERIYELSPIQKRAEIMLKLAKELLKKSEDNEKLKEQANEILDIIIQEYDENHLIILDYMRNHELESITKLKHEYYARVYEEAMELK